MKIYQGTPASQGTPVYGCDHRRRQQRCYLGLPVIESMAALLMRQREQVWLDTHAPEQ